MRLRTFAALAGGVLTAVSVLLFIRTGDEPAQAANGNFRLFAPGLTNSSAFIPTPTPTPTPIGGGGGGGGNGPLDIYVSLEILAQEPNTDPDGMVELPMFAAASADFPAPDDPPVTVSGSVTIAPHPVVDDVGCSWERTYASEEFTMTVLPPQPGSTGVSLVFESPEWHYTISCPEVGVVTRLPAFGEITMLAYVGFAFPEYVPAGAPVDVPEVSVAPDCIKREVTLHRIVQLADVTLRVVIYEPPCLLPLP